MCSRPRVKKWRGESMLGQLKITWTDMSDYYKYKSLRFKNVKEVKLDNDRLIEILADNHIAIIDAHRDDVLIITSDVSLDEFPLHLLKYYLEKAKVK